MTNEQVHHYLFSAIETGEQVDVKTDEGHEIYLIAEKAVEKQIPKKIIKEWDCFENDTNYYRFICPSCENRNENPNAHFKHCPDCGQAISWEVEE